MGSKYTTQSASGYNSSPPSDDGSQTASNLIKWATHKSKLADPVKNLADAINTALVTAMDYSVRQITASDSIAASDHMKTVEVAPTATSGLTVTLGDAATLTSNFRFFLKNSSQYTVTLARTTSSDTLDAQTENFSIPAGFCGVISTTTGADGFIFVGKYDESEPGVPDGRLTLTSGTPVTTADVTSATTVYYALHKGNKISLFDGKRWRKYTFTELSIAVPATTNTMYDVFCYDNAGTPALELASWTSDIARATSLTRQDGVYVKTGSLTRRYLGSFRTTGISGQTEDSAAKRYVWNAYNRLPRLMRVLEATDSWNYTTATYRQANGSTSNQLDVVIGLSEDAVTASVLGSALNSSGAVQLQVGIGLDSTSTLVSGCLTPKSSTQVANTVAPQEAEWIGYPGVGRHTLVWLEFSAATGTTTWYGDNAAATLNQSGIHGTVLG